MQRQIINHSFCWLEVSESQILLAPNTGYRIKTQTLAKLRLPMSAAVNSEIRIDGQTGGWELIQQEGQQILFGDLASSPGEVGGLRGTLPSDYAELLYLGEEAWKVVRAIGNFDIF
jgi:hypothetical protein